MPTISFVLSFLTVSSLAIYSYLGTSKDIQEAENKIKDEEVMSLLLKEAHLNNVISTHSNDKIGSKTLHKIIKITTSTTKTDLDSFKVFEEDIQTLVDSGNFSPSCSDVAVLGHLSLTECNHIMDKNITFYNSMDLNEKTVNKLSSFKAKTKNIKSLRYVKIKNDYKEFLKSSIDPDAIVSIMKKTMDMPVFMPKVLLPLSINKLTTLETTLDENLSTQKAEIIKLQNRLTVKEQFVNDEKSIINLFDANRIVTLFNLSSSINKVLAQYSLNEKKYSFIKQIKNCKDTYSNDVSGYNNCKDLIITTATDWVNANAEALVSSRGN